VPTSTTTWYDAEIRPDDHWWVVGRARSLDTILRRYVAPGGPSLDVGAGTGIWSVRLAKRHAPVITVEPDPRLRLMVRARAGSAGRVLAATLPGPLPFDNDRFKLVTCLDVLEHLDDDRSSMQELVRVLAPGGHLLVTVPAHPHLWSAKDVDVGHRRRYSEYRFRELIEETKLKPAVVGPLNVWLYPPAAVGRRLGFNGARMPGPRINRLLSALFGSEGRLVERWPSFARGLSWVALLRRDQTA
jgi:SAM-dependent methyltransferase